MSRLLSLILLIAATVFAGESDNRLRVYWADVEGGGATMIVTPEGESVLIDTGFPGERDSKRIFEIAKNAGLKRIDYLITTHYHLDHFGGAADLAKLIPIGAVYDNGTFEGQTEKPSKEYQLFAAEKRVVINPGDELPLKKSTKEGIPSVVLKCLAARKQFITAPGDAKRIEVAEPKRLPQDLSDNANSVVSLISFGAFRFYVGGDLTWNMEEKLVNPVNIVGKVDVYQVTHHGQDNSNNPLVINALEPTVAVMSNGAAKGCGPQSGNFLKTVPSLKAVFQIHRSTREDGSHNTVPERIANMEKECKGNHIEMTVDTATGKYTVSIPATKLSETFEIKK